MDISIDELRRVVPSLKKPGDTAVVSGIWAPSHDAKRVSALFVAERIEPDDVVFTLLAVAEAA